MARRVRDDIRNFQATRPLDTGLARVSTSDGAQAEPRGLLQTDTADGDDPVVCSGIGPRRRLSMAAVLGRRPTFCEIEEANRRMGRTGVAHFMGGGRHWQLWTADAQGSIGSNPLRAHFMKRHRELLDDARSYSKLNSVTKYLVIFGLWADAR